MLLRNSMDLQFNPQVVRDCQTEDAEIYFSVPKYTDLFCAGKVSISAGKY